MCGAAGGDNIRPGKMMRKRNAAILLVLTCWAALGGGAGRAAAAALAPVALRCEYRVNPSGLDETAPRLSWQVTSKQRDERQSAWEVLVAGTEAALAHDKGDFWESGKVAGDDTTGIVYGGRALAS